MLVLRRCDFWFLKWTVVPKKINGLCFLKPVFIFLQTQTAWVGKQDITMCIKNVVCYRQFVSLEVYKIANTPFLGWVFSLLLRIQCLRFLPQW